MASPSKRWSKMVGNCDNQSNSSLFRRRRIIHTPFDSCLDFNRFSQLLRNLFVLLVLMPGVSFCGTAEKPKQIVFKVRQLEISGKTLEVEMAQTPEQRERGLMYRKSLADGKGMLFVFPRQRTLSFWMKNTLIPLSIGYFTEDRVLVEVVDMLPESPMVLDSQLKTYPSKRPVKFALEVPKGWFAKNKVKLGSKFKLSKPTR